MSDAEKSQEPAEESAKRPNYFAGQYLLEEDFKSEQNYHIDRQRRHNRLLHVSGIAKGLTVSNNQGLTVKVAAGTAFDSQGRQIILLYEKAVDLLEANNKNPIKDGEYTLSIRYSEELTDKQGEDEFTTTRVQEKPEFVLSSSSAKHDDTISLAKLTIKGKNVTIDQKVREYSGINLPTEDGKGVTLRSQVGVPNQAILEGSLSITGELTVLGRSDMRGSLKVNGELHIVHSLQIGDGTETQAVNRIVNEIREGTKEKADAHALLTVKAAVDYADTKAEKNGDSKENFTAANLTVKQLTINKKPITAISEIISESGDQIESVIPTSAAVKSYVDSSREKEVKKEYKWNKEENCGELEVTWEGSSNNFIVPITMTKTEKMHITPKGIDPRKIQIILVEEGREVKVERTETGIRCEWEVVNDEDAICDLEGIYTNHRVEWATGFPEQAYGEISKWKEWGEVIAGVRELAKGKGEGSRKIKVGSKAWTKRCGEWLGLVIIESLREFMYEERNTEKWEEDEVEVVKFDEVYRQESEDYSQYHLAYNEGLAMFLYLSEAESAVKYVQENQGDYRWKRNKRGGGKELWSAVLIKMPEVSSEEENK